MKNRKTISLDKNTESILIASEMRYRRLFESAKDGILILDAKTGKIIDVNPFLLEMMGYAKSEFLGFRLWEIESFGELVASEEAFRKLQENQYARYDNLPLFTKTGECKDVEFITNLYTMDGEKILHCNIRDITERKKMGDALKRAKEFNSSLLENISDGVVACDAQGRIALFNRASREWLGMDSISILPKEWPNYFRLYHSDGITPMSTGDFPLFRAFNGESISDVGMTIVAKDKSPRHVIVNGGPFFDNQRNKLGAMVVMCDITERKRAEAEKARLEMRLRESQKMEAVGQLAGGVAHDFNNLLTVINGYTQMLLLSSEASTQPELEEVLRAGERASALTRQLLVFSRRQALESKIIDFNAIISDMEKMLRRLIREDISLERYSGSDLWPVKADPGQMEQVIMNLVINARDAMPEGGKLSIQTENVKIDGKNPMNNPGDIIPGFYVKFSVADTGCGMSDEVKKHLFEPFFTTKEQGKGTGLGLATVYGIVKQNGGYIDVQSEVGKGSRFQIYFPRIATEVLKDDKTLKAAPILQGRETVLLVEDETNVRILIREFLKSIGYAVLLASNGKEALELAENHKDTIHLLLTDIVMPGMSGLELAKQLKGMFPEVKLLFMSGYAKSSDGKGLLDINKNFIQKPISIYPLSIKLREILDK